MTDELVRRLREWAVSREDCNEAADEIDRLTAELAEAQRSANDMYAGQARLYAERDALRAALGLRTAQCDALLNHCDKDNGECGECGRIICPHKDPMHFHHDGCPSCSDEDDAALAASVASEPLSVQPIAAWIIVAGILDIIAVLILR